MLGLGLLETIIIIFILITVSVMLVGGILLPLTISFLVLKHTFQHYRS